MASSSAHVKETLGELNKESFVSLLSKLIGEAKYVQNNPPDLIPEEDRVVKHVLDSLLPYSTTKGGGPLIVNHVTYYQGRGNIIVEYPGTVPGNVLSFVGCHMDVVTANPNDWVCFFLSLSFFLCFLFWVFAHLTIQPFSDHNFQSAMVWLVLVFIKELHVISYLGLLLSLFVRYLFWVSIHLAIQSFNNHDFNPVWYG